LRSFCAILGLVRFGFLWLGTLKELIQKRAHGYSVGAKS
jgi:hypothetical protein